MYAKILVPVDGGDTAARGLDEAIRLAKSQGSTIRLLHVVDDLAAYVSPQAAVYSEQLLETVRAHGRAILAEAEAVVRQHGLTPEAKWVESTGGPAGDAIVEEARQWPADLIVLGTHGRRGLRRLVLGSDAEHVVRTASVPVLLVRGTKAAPKD
jgi:nucleotide-binding universal stress UspA family protein